MENLTRKIFDMVTKSIIISFVITCYIVLFYKNNQNLISDKTLSLTSELIAWVPLITCILLCIVYSFVLFSDEFRKIRSNIYLSVLLQVLLFFLIVLPQEVTEKLDYKISIILLVLLFALNLFFHGRIKKELVKKNFSIKKEFLIMEKVNEHIKETAFYKWSDLFNKMFWLFVVPFVTETPKLLFCCIVGLIAILLIYLLIKYITCFQNMQDAETCKINSSLLIFNFIVSVILGIIFYCLFKLKLIAFITLYSGLFSTLMFDKKYAMYMRRKLKLHSV